MQPEDEAPAAEEVPADETLLRFGERIVWARQRALFTQQMLADQLGTTQTAVSYWEAGKRDPGVSGLLRIADACLIPGASLLPEEHRQQSAVAPTAGGQFMEIAFMGHVEREGYVTEVTIGGEPGYHIDLPDKLFDGNPYAWEEYSAKALFSRWPVREETLRVRWETARRRAGERAKREAEWRRMDEQRALTAGGDSDREVWADEDNPRAVPF